ncbi:MAG: PAS domain S-box protein, partial [Candidatus Heimdallarchaeota archaeon]
MFRILLVDDEEDYLAIGEEFLTDEDQDFEVVTSTSAQQAIQLLSEDGFDAIVADYRMPDMDGLELLENLRNDGNTIPFVIFTRHSREEVAIRALNLGADYYLTKGGDPASQYGELAHIIRSAILHRRTEAALRESEEKFRALADQALMGILIMQSNEVIYTNKALADFMGYSLEEILAWSVSDFIEKAHPDDLGFALAQYEQESSGVQDSPPRYNLRLITKGGATRWVTISSQEIQLRSGPAVGALIADNTEQRLAEQQLRESEEKFRAMAEQSLLGTLIMQNQRIIYANEAVTNFFGYSQEEMLAWEPGELFQKVHPEDREFVINQYRKKQTGDSDVVPSYEVRAITKSGEIKWALLHSQHIHLRTGPAISASIIDITDQKLINKKLRESEERFRDLANLLPSCIFEADLSGYLTFANRFARELFGYTQEDLDQGVNVLQFFAPDDTERLVTNFQRKLSGEMLGEEGRHYQALRKDGTSFPSYIYTSPIMQDQKPIGLRGILIDNTDQKEAEAALRESEEKYRALVENIPIGLSRTTPGPKGEFLMANPALVDLLGFESEDNLKQFSVAEIYMHPSERIAFSDNLLAQGGVSRAELQYKRKDGTPIWGATTGRVVHEANEEVKY